MPTAFLTASTFEVLPFLGTPGAATVGHALVWSESPKGFTLAPISVGPDQFSGVLPVAKGGWGTDTGSFTSPGAISLTAATNNNLALSFSGTGAFLLNQGQTNRFGIKSNGIIHFFGEPIPDVNLPFQIRAANNLGYFGINDGDNYAALIGYDASNQSFDGVVIRNVKSPSGSGANISLVVNNTAIAAKILGNTDAIFYSTTSSTSTTTGAVQIAGGLGVASNVNIGGNLRFAGGTVPATATSAGTTGDIRYDGSHLYICTATNTWVRTALSTW